VVRARWPSFLPCGEWHKLTWKEIDQ